ncbi:MAG: site-2 protease family protein [Acidobacteriota bacterium]|nr:site-2 protease family protein [Acidobacteriota bacterium]
MSTNGYPQPSGAFEGNLFEALDDTGLDERPRHRYWLHALLFLLTLLSTTVVGAGFAQSFAANRPSSFNGDLYGYVRMWHQPSFLLQGLPFSLTLLTILMAHEMGHYLTARYYGVDVSLPYFLPAPTLIGTMGAFIRIRSAIYSKRALFDIGIAGPIAGFVILLAPLAVGLSLSRVSPAAVRHSDLIFGSPLLLQLFERMAFPGARMEDIYLHPMARAAWVGLLATALNLLPIGQLDGGHILYAFAGEKTRWLSRFFVALLIPMGIFFAYSWLLWAVLLFFFGMRHPVIYDPYPIGRARTWLGLAALIILILTFTLSPVRANGL